MHKLPSPEEVVFILFRSTGDDDLDLMGRRRSRADDQVGDEELDGVDKEQEGEVDKEGVGKHLPDQLKTKKVEEEDKKEEEEEEDLEYLRLNCTRMGTRRATNFSQVWHSIYFYEYPCRALRFLDRAFYSLDCAKKRKGQPMSAKHDIHGLPCSLFLQTFVRGVDF